jgi:ubiquinone/menaquinone biosynthesis C-methylase UbiE
VLAQGHGKHHDFSDIERWIKAFEDPARAEWQKPDQVVELLGLKSGQNVADIGAGTGYFTRRMAKKVLPGGIAVAVDIQADFFPYVNDKALEAKQDNIFTQLALPDNPRLGEGVYDLIFICNTLHHIEHRAEYYAWLRRGLRPNGRVVIVDFFKDMEIPVGPKPSERLASGDVRREFESAGFTVSVDAETLPYQYILTATPRNL